MNVTLDRAAFLAELQLCAAAADKRSTIPILCAVLLDAKDGKVNLAGTDLNLTILSSTAAEIEEAGQTAIEAQTLIEIVRTLDGDTVTLVTDGARSLAVTGGAAHFTTPAYDPLDYPVLPVMEGEAAQIMELATLQKLLRSVAPGLGPNDPRATLDRTCLRFENGTVTAFGSDGIWFLRSSVSVAKAPASDIYAIPATMTSALGKLEAVGNAEAWFTANDSHLAVTCDHRTILARRSELNFPDYDPWTPEPTIIALVNRETLAAVVARANVTAKGTSRMLILTLADGLLILTHTNVVRGTFSESFVVDYRGEEIVRGLSGRYLTDALRTMECPMVELGFVADVEKPVLISPANQPDFQQLAVIAPMRIK